MKVKNAALILAVSMGTILSINGYTPPANPQYLAKVINNAGADQKGYFFITTDIPLYEPTDLTNSIISQVNTNKKNLDDILPILKCARTKTSCTGIENCTPPTTLTQCNLYNYAYGTPYNLYIPGKGKSADFYSIDRADYYITNILGDPTAFYNPLQQTTGRPKTLIAVPQDSNAVDPIIMIGRDNSGKFYTAAFMLKDNIDPALGLTSDAVYYPLDDIKNRYVDLGTTGGSLTLEIKPISGEGYTLDYTPVLTSGSQSTETIRNQSVPTAGW